MPAQSGIVLSRWMAGSESAIVGHLLIPLLSCTLCSGFALVLAHLPGAGGLGG